MTWLGVNEFGKVCMNAIHGEFSPHAQFSWDKVWILTRIKRLPKMNEQETQEKQICRVGLQRRINTRYLRNKYITNLYNKCHEFHISAFSTFPSTMFCLPKTASCLIYMHHASSISIITDNGHFRMRKCSWTLIYCPETAAFVLL